MKIYKHFFIRYINNNLYGYLHETSDFKKAEDGDIYQINPTDVHYFMSSELFKKNNDIDDYQIVNYDHMLCDIKTDLYHNDGVLVTQNDSNITLQAFPKTMIFYNKNYNQSIDKKAVNKIVDYIELNFSTNEKVISKFKNFLKDFDIKFNNK